MHLSDKVLAWNAWGPGFKKKKKKGYCCEDIPLCWNWSSFNKKQDTEGNSQTFFVLRAMIPLPNFWIKKSKTLSDCEKQQVHANVYLKAYKWGKVISHLEACRKLQFVE